MAGAVSILAGQAVALLSLVIVAIGIATMLLWKPSYAMSAGSISGNLQITPTSVRR
jgi:hypothetical protein